MYFVGGWEEWPKSEGEPIDLELEDGNMSMHLRKSLAYCLLLCLVCARFVD